MAADHSVDNPGPLIPDPAGAARAWREKHQAIQVNHLVAVNATLSRSDPDVVAEVYLFDDVTRGL
jgi:hypothetical protein